ncbi:hypothetical protein, partial [Stenotrophomonas maltophilia]|uniref:hypothetical protein n=1 Tax=Stenotrophomonas maltophilia TaxID=40324 RepID=UPI0013DBABC4
MDRRAHDNRWRELATANPEGSAIYEHERQNQSGIMRLSRHERFTREIHLAINGARGLPVQVMPVGA